MKITSSNWYEITITLTPSELAFVGEAMSFYVKKSENSNKYDAEIDKALRLAYNEHFKIYGGDC